LDQSSLTGLDAGRRRKWCTIRIAMKVRLLTLAAAGLAAGAIVFAQDMLFLPEGSEAPEISGEATDGKRLSLKELSKEKPAFIVFWKERCPHNPRAAALFNAIHKAYEGKVSFFGVVTASPEGAKSWVEEFKLNYPLVPDAERKIIKDFQLKNSICTFQIDPDGKVAKVYPGYGRDALEPLNAAMAKAAGVEVAEVDLSAAPAGRRWG
jgi:peroxiredoxin